MWLTLIVNYFGGILYIQNSTFDILIMHMYYQYISHLRKFTLFPNNTFLK